MEVVFKRVETPERSKTVARIAAPIWHATYDAINGADATDYMIEQFQSVPAIRRQLDREGHAYYLMLRGEAGLCRPRAAQGGEDVPQQAVRLTGAPRAGLRARRLILLRRAAREGLDKILPHGQQAQHARDRGLPPLRLYEIDSVVTDIGRGYVMDDYIRQKRMCE